LLPVTRSITSEHKTMAPAKIAAIMRRSNEGVTASRPLEFPQGSGPVPRVRQARIRKACFFPERYDLRDNFCGTSHLSLGLEASHQPPQRDDRYRNAWSICIAPHGRRLCPRGAIERLSGGVIRRSSHNTREPPAIPVGKTDVTSAFRLLRAGALAGRACHLPWWPFVIPCDW
jgi:hypothetical protein